MRPTSASGSRGWRGGQVGRWGGVAFGSERLAPRVEFVEPVAGRVDDESQAGPLKMPGGAGAGLPAFLKIGFERQAIIIDQRGQLRGGLGAQAERLEMIDLFQEQGRLRRELPIGDDLLQL